jgi:hypothetical protein
MMRRGWILVLAAGLLAINGNRARAGGVSVPTPAAKAASAEAEPFANGPHDSAELRPAVKEAAENGGPPHDGQKDPAAAAGAARPAAKEKAKDAGKKPQQQIGATGARPAAKEPVKEAAQPAPLTPPHAPPANGPGALDPHAADGPAPGTIPSRFWGEAELLFWWIKNSNTPPLVSVGPPSSGGILTQGATTVFGGSINNEERMGGRFTVGTWLDCEGKFGIEGSYFFLGSRGIPFTTGSNGGPGSPAIGRPFFNILTGMEDAQLLAFPGVAAGSVSANLTSRLQGAELNFVCRHCCCSDCWRLEFLSGFRYLELHEGLGIAEDIQVLPGVPIIGGDRFLLNDQFDTNNHFYGWQLGARGEYRRGPWFVGACGKVALGESHETVTISGSTTIITPAGTTVAQGGLLALPTNIGRFNRDAFAVVPEVGISVGCQLTCALRVFAGYTFLYWSDVARPGDQIDRVINPTLLPVNMAVGPPVGPARPSFTFHETDFWAQGIHVGLEYRY